MREVLFGFPPGGVERIAWFAPDDPRWAYDGTVLVPWPNRIAGGRYVDGGVARQLEITEPETGSALHGLATGVD